MQPLLLSCDSQEAYELVVWFAEDVYNDRILIGGSGGDMVNRPEKEEATGSSQDGDDFIRRLTELRDEAKRIVSSLSAGQTGQTTPVGVLEGIVKKYRDQTGLLIAARPSSLPQFGIASVIPLLEELPVLQYWIFKKARIVPPEKISEAAAAPSRVRAAARRAVRVAKLRRSRFRRMTLEQLVGEQSERLTQLVQLLNHTKRITDNLYGQLYDRHIEMQEDAIAAQKDIEIIRAHVSKLDEVNRLSSDLDVEPKSETGLRISTLITHIHKLSGPITEFHDDCNATIDWLFETQDSYHTFEELMGSYSRMINAIRRRALNLQGYVDDLTSIAERVREGQEVSRDLLQSMLALSSGVFGSTNAIRSGIQEIAAVCGNLESLRLPAYVNQILGSPLADVVDARRMLAKSPHAEISTVI